MKIVALMIGQAASYSDLLKPFFIRIRQFLTPKMISRLIWSSLFQKQKFTDAITISGATQDKINEIKVLFIQGSRLCVRALLGEGEIKSVDIRAILKQKVKTKSHHHPP